MKSAISMIIPKDTVLSIRLEADKRRKQQEEPLERGKESTRRPSAEFSLPSPKDGQANWDNSLLESTNSFYS